MEVSEGFVERKLDEAMPWVGIYIAAASAACTLAMAADAFNGLRRKRLWFPCKYFPLNATSLTLLAVAMKLPIDLTTNMYTSWTDVLAKVISMLFMSTALANFMSSLGSMSDKEILANVVALGILVTTVAANMSIQITLLGMFSIVSLPAMLILLIELVSIAIMVPTTKRRLEAKYQERHKIALREEEVLNRRDAFRIEDQRGYMMKYWVMAETSNPQFVLAHSIICNTAICVLVTLTIVEKYLFLFIAIEHKVSFPKPRTAYKSTTMWIQVIQFIGVVIGSIAPTLRWFAAVSFNCSRMNRKSFKKAFKIESHWIQLLVDCRDSFSASQIQRNKYRKCLHDAKWFAITSCIGLQILTIQLNRLFGFLSVVLTSPFFLCFILIKIFVNRLSSKVEELGDDDLYLDLSRYVLQLEGEPELPKRVLKNMCHEANNMIQTGQKKQPHSLLSLLGKFENFNGLGEFDSNQILSLYSQEPPNCWTLPVVTLTTIAIALPNTAKHKREQLLSSVSEGLSLAKIVEKSLYENAHLVNIRMAADICWGGVLLHMKWLEINLKGVSIKCKNSKEVLQELSKKAEAIIMEFKEEEKDPTMENPPNWPPKVVAANSMYRICQTMLLSYEEENEPTDGELYEQLSVMIADILAACLTNLPHVITIMCHRNAIEKREKSVRKAFLLLGKTEQVVQLLQQQEWPHLDQDKAAYIDEWRALFQGQDNGDSATSTSSDEISTTPVSIEEHLAITVDC